VAQEFERNHPVYSLCKPCDVKRFNGPPGPSRSPSQLGKGEARASPVASLSERAQPASHGIGAAANRKAQERPEAMSERRKAPWRGRKRVEDPRDKFIGVRCNEKEYANITAAAVRMGLAAGAYLRSVGTGSPGLRAKRRPAVERRALGQVLGLLPTSTKSPAWRTPKARFPASLWGSRPTSERCAPR
jgi:hypothetical protein